MNGILLWYFELASYLLEIDTVYYLIPSKCMSCICLVVSILLSVEENLVNMYFPIARKTYTHVLLYLFLIALNNVFSCWVLQEHVVWFD
jgi:hypothetical protein